jgi:hypothetical protein
MKITCPIYYVDIYAYIGVKYSACVDDLKRRKITNDYELKNTEDGICLRLSNGSIVIWTKKKNIFTIAHECFHATQNILERAGIYLENETREAYAYYFEWLLKICVKAGVK